MASLASRRSFTAAPEIDRQRAVNRSGVLSGWASADLQQIVDRAAKIFRTPMAAISIIDQQRQWFAARLGIEEQETPRSQSFCAHAIHHPGEPLIVEDTTQDPRFSGHPMVTGDAHIRFYAGVPLVDRMGYALGALCIVDTVPREMPENIIELTMLAHEAERAIKR